MRTVLKWVNLIVLLTAGILLFVVVKMWLDGEFTTGEQVITMINIILYTTAWYSTIERGLLP